MYESKNLEIHKNIILQSKGALFFGSIFPLNPLIGELESKLSRNIDKNEEIQQEVDENLQN